MVDYSAAKCAFICLTEVEKGIGSARVVSPVNLIDAVIIASGGSHRFCYTEWAPPNDMYYFELAGLDHHTLELISWMAGTSRA